MATTKSWVLLLVDPHDFTRQCLADLLRTAADDLVVVEASHLDQVSGETLDACDVVLVGRNDATGTSPEAVLRLQRQRPEVPVAMLGNLRDPQEGLAVLRQGIRGYLSPALSAREIVAALRLVRAGGAFIGPSPEPSSPRAAVAAADFPITAATPAPGGLTPRERDVLAHLRTGKPNKLIAYELQISENTVKVHVGRLLKKLQAPNRTAVVCLRVDGPAAHGTAAQAPRM